MPPGHRIIPLKSNSRARLASPRKYPGHKNSAGFRWCPPWRHLACNNVTEHFVFPGNTEESLALVFSGRLWSQKVLLAMNFKCKSTLKEQIEAIWITKHVLLADEVVPHRLSLTELRSQILSSTRLSLSVEPGRREPWERGWIGHLFFKCDGMHLRWVFTVKTAVIHLKNIFEFVFQWSASIPFF